MTSKSKDTVYEMVTERVVEMLQAGVAPWSKPWTGGSAPRNIEGRRYRGINVFLLAMNEYESPFWLTFKQAKERGGSVKKGEKSTLIVFWQMRKVTDKDAAPGEDKTKVIPLLRYFRVFNLEQTEGVRLPKAVAEYNAAREAHETRVEAEEILAGYVGGPVVHETGDEAVYYPSLDTIHVPPRGTFRTPDEFYTTVFHELGHSTGHPSRLDRKQGDRFGSHDYGREELVAEMTAAYLAAESGIESTVDNSAAYLAAWIKTIKQDVRAVVVAAGAAQRAADLILGRTAEHADAQPTEAPAKPVTLAA